MPTGALPLLVNLDVPDPGAAATLYIAAFGLRHGRRLGDGAAIELLGATSPLYLLEKATGSTGAGSRPRDYTRHWMPCHIDLVVPDLERALARAEAAGLQREGNLREAAWGRIVQLADPWGHGWCLLQFSDRGYDAIATGA